MSCLSSAFLFSGLFCPLLHLLQLPFCFSLKYAKYLEGFSIEGVRHVYKKACTIHLTKKPNIHLLWAAFEEQQGEKRAQSKQHANQSNNLQRARGGIMGKKMYLGIRVYTDAKYPWPELL